MGNFCVRVYRNGSICLPLMLLYPPTPIIMSHPPSPLTSSPHYLIVVLCGPALSTPAVVHCCHQSRAIATALLLRCRHHRRSAITVIALPPPPPPPRCCRVAVASGAVLHHICRPANTLANFLATLFSDLTTIYRTLSHSRKKTRNLIQ